jgi:aminotransferase
MMKIHQYSILCAATTSQDAAIEALERGDGSILRMKREYELRRNYIVSALNDMGLTCAKPHGAFYAFPNVASTGLTSREFSLRLLQDKRVAVVPGGAFGESGEGFVRCSYATGLPQIKTAMERMAEFVTEIRSEARSAA